MVAKDPEIADLTILVLREIRDEVKKSNERLGHVEEELSESNEGQARLEAGLVGTNAHLGSLERRFESLEKATMDGFSGVRRELDQVNQRLDGLRDIAGGANRERIDKLEERVDRIETQRG